MKLISKFFLGLVLVFFLLPIVGTVVFSIATSWSGTLLPKGLTLEWYAAIFKEPEFLGAFKNSIMLSLTSAVMISIVIVSVVLVVELYHKPLHSYLKILEITPYVIPGVVLAIGIITVFAKVDVNDFALLVCSYLIILFPFAYRSLSNRLKYIDIKATVNASRVLGVSDFVCIVKVILPQMKNTLLAIGLISFSSMLGEYTFVKILVGGRFMTLSQYLFKLKALSTHMAAAANIIIMGIILITAAIALIVLRKEQTYGISKN